MKLLIHEPPLQVLPSLAIRIGLNEAIVLQQLHYLTLKSKGAPIEKRLDEWAEQFPFWSLATIKRTFRSLREKGLIVVEQPHGTDRSNRYRVAYEAVAALDQDDPVEEVNLTPSSGSGRDAGADQRDPVQQAKSSPSYIEGEVGTTETSGDEAHASSPATSTEADASVDTNNDQGSEPTSLAAVEEPTALTDKRGAKARSEKPEYVRLADLLGELIVANGSKAPTAAQLMEWRNDARLMVEQDGRTPEQIEAAIRWTQSHSFWRSNVLSMGKLREQYDRLRLQAMRERRSSRAEGNRAVLDVLEGSGG